MRHRRSSDLHEIRPPDAAGLLRRVRLVTGLVLLAYLATHLLNHALGLISLATMEAGRGWFLAFWRHPVGTLALYGALATHVTLALWSVYRRRHICMPAWEAAQLLLGLLIPPSWSRISSARDWRTSGSTRRIPIPASSWRSGSSGLTSGCARHSC